MNALHTPHVGHFFDATPDVLALVHVRGYQRVTFCWWTARGKRIVEMYRRGRLVGRRAVEVTL